ncbi:MAG: hypothetical protein R2795_05600 [Saprospiraceae bacterium]
MVTFTTQNQGNDATDSDADEDGFTVLVTVTAGEVNTTIDAGLIPEAEFRYGENIGRCYA